MPAPMFRTILDIARAGLLWPASMHEAMKRPLHPVIAARLRLAPASDTQADDGKEASR